VRLDLPAVKGRNVFDYHQEWPRGLSLIYPVMIDFDKSIMKYPSIKRYRGARPTTLCPICSIRKTRCPSWPILPR
jgi:hypothetical protein